MCPLSTGTQVFRQYDKMEFLLCVSVFLLELEPYFLESSVESGCNKIVINITVGFKSQKKTNSLVNDYNDEISNDAILFSQMVK